MGKRELARVDDRMTTDKSPARRDPCHPQEPSIKVHGSTGGQGGKKFFRIRVRNSRDTPTYLWRAGSPVLKKTGNWGDAGASCRTPPAEADYSVPAWGVLREAPRLGVDNSQTLLGKRRAASVARRFPLVRRDLPVSLRPQRLWAPGVTRVGQEDAKPNGCSRGKSGSARHRRSGRCFVGQSPTYDLFPSRARKEADRLSRTKRSLTVAAR